MNKLHHTKYENILIYFSFFAHNFLKVVILTYDDDYINIF